MSSKTPTARQVAWISLMPHALVLALMVWPWHQFAYPDELTMAFAYGAMSYLLLSKLLRNPIPKSHRAGMHKVKAEDFKAAIPYFEKSYQFFKEYQWVDNYRHLLVLTSTAASYKEMALLNAAFCYGQIGEGKKSKESYEQVLKEFPESGVAIAALKQIEAAEE